MPDYIFHMTKQVLNVEYPVILLGRQSVINHVLLFYPLPTARYQRLYLLRTQTVNVMLILDVASKRQQEQGAEKS